MSFRVAGIAACVVGLISTLALVALAFAGLFLMTQGTAEVSALGVDFYVQSVTSHGWLVGVFIAGIAAAIIAAGSSAVALVGCLE